MSSTTRYLTSLVDLLEEIGNMVSLYGQYEEMFLDQPRFQAALGDLCEDILEVLVKACRVFKKSGKAFYRDTRNAR